MRYRRPFNESYRVVVTGRSGQKKLNLKVKKEYHGPTHLGLAEIPEGVAVPFEFKGEVWEKPKESADMFAKSAREQGFRARVRRTKFAYYVDVMRPT
jgi:hypothetical protein